MEGSASGRQHTIQTNDFSHDCGEVSQDDESQENVEMP